MDSRQVARVCAVFALGAPVAEPEAVTGGLLHRLWRLTTTRGRFAVKVLNPALVRRPGGRDEYRLTERIARAMAAAGVPAVTARDARGGDGGPVQEIGGATMMAFAWVEGERLSPGPASPERARLIGALLARMHTLDLAVPGLRPPRWEPFADGEWATLVDRAGATGLPWAGALRAALPELAALNALYTGAIAPLGRTLVPSHRDLDQKNVLWRDARTPAIVDWETAGLTNPTLDLAGWALDWAGQTVGPPSRATFDATLAGYRDAGGPLRDAGRTALHGCLGNWLGWLQFNMRRSLGDDDADPDERALGLRETVDTLAIVRSLAANLDTWGGWLDEYR